MNEGISNLFVLENLKKDETQCDNCNCGPAQLVEDFKFAANYFQNASFLKNYYLIRVFRDAPENMPRLEKQQTWEFTRNASFLESA